jgi:hypothetical protein
MKNICSSSGGARWRKMKDRNDSLPPKLLEKLVWVPVISLRNIFIPSYWFDGLLCRNWPISIAKLYTDNSKKRCISEFDPPPPPWRLLYFLAGIGRVLGGYQFFLRTTNLLCQWDLTLKHVWVQGPNTTHSHSRAHDWNTIENYVTQMTSLSDSWKISCSKSCVVVLEKKHHTKVYTSSSSCTHQYNL